MIQERRAQISPFYPIHANGLKENGKDHLNRPFPLKGEKRCPCASGLPGTRGRGTAFCPRPPRIRPSAAVSGFFPAYEQEHAPACHLDKERCAPKAKRYENTGK